MTFKLKWERLVCNIFFFIKPILEPFPNPRVVYYNSLLRVMDWFQNASVYNNWMLRMRSRAPHNSGTMTATLLHYIDSIKILGQRLSEAPREVGSLSSTMPGSTSTSKVLEPLRRIPAESRSIARGIRPPIVALSLVCCWEPFQQGSEGSRMISQR